MVRLDVIESDISKSQADAVIYVTNTILPEGEDRAGAYLEGAAPCEAGRVTVLSPKQSGGPVVLQIEGPEWKEGKAAELKELEACYSACLGLAAEKGFEAVDILAVPSGVYDSRMFQIATTTFRAVLDFRKTHELPGKVCILCRDDREVMTYKQAYNFWFADVKSARMDYEGWD